MFSKNPYDGVFIFTKDSIFIKENFTNSLLDILYLINKFNNVSFGNAINESLDILPDTITHLSIWNSCDIPIYKFPSNLIELELSNNHNYIIDNLPQTLEILSIGKFTYDKNSKPFSNYPPNLKKLKISSNNSTGFDNLPSGLEELIISSSEKIDLDNLPESLKILQIINGKNIQLEHLPNGLETLIINDSSCMSEISLPNNLISLSINPLLASITCFPQSLQKLKINHHFSGKSGWSIYSSFLNEKLPINLKELIFDSNLNKDINLNILPDTIEVLNISSNQDCHITKLPSNIKKFLTSW